tara:strand:- start:311 stop:1150 length:840 start_codon:yes stop_codon:yes gene_type:complete
MQPSLLGLIGKNILASKSPLLHQSEAAAQGFQLIYKLYDFAVTGESTEDLEEYLRAAEVLGFSGFNITHPFKQAIIPFLDELSDEARMIHAVNTVIFRDNKRIGHNTDYSGFIDAFADELGAVPLNKVVQLGAGGAGSAIAAAMLKLGTGHLYIHDKDMHRAHALADNLNQLFGADKVSAVADSETLIQTADGLINTTPVGMSDFPGMPVSPDLLRSELWLADIIYFPPETELLSNARAAGCLTMNGERMAVYQAARAFELFTGLAADRDRMLCNLKAT